MPQEQRLRLFQNLVAAAAIDGEIGDEERSVLASCARGLGIGEADFVTAIAMATAGALKVVVPKDHQERDWTLATLARVVHADGKVTPGERRLLSAFATRMGVSEPELEQRMRE